MLPDQLEPRLHLFDDPRELEAVRKLVLLTRIGNVLGLSGLPLAPLAVVLALGLLLSCQSQSINARWKSFRRFSFERTECLGTFAKAAAFPAVALTVVQAL